VWFLPIKNEEETRCDIGIRNSLFAAKKLASPFPVSELSHPLFVDHLPPPDEPLPPPDEPLPPPDELLLPLDELPPL
jgi:hypothetical protein